MARPPTELTRRAVDINVVGALVGMRGALLGMTARGRGHIVNVASAAGKAPVPGGITYAASKAAVVSLTESAGWRLRASLSVSILRDPWPRRRPSAWR